jgi:hypothetical protein
VKNQAVLGIDIVDYDTDGVIKGLVLNFNITGQGRIRSDSLVTKGVVDADNSYLRTALT